jgi:hypothetical protein
VDALKSAIQDITFILIAKVEMEDGVLRISIAMQTAFIN